MKKIIITLLATFLSFTAVSVHAESTYDGFTLDGDPLGKKILSTFIRRSIVNRNMHGYTIRLYDHEVAQFKAGKYRAIAKAGDIRISIGAIDADTYPIDSRDYGIRWLETNNGKTIHDYCTNMRFHAGDKYAPPGLKIQYPNEDGMCRHLM